MLKIIARCHSNFILVSVALLASFLSAKLHAASLSGSLSIDDVKNITEKIVFPSSHRSWTAHSLSPEGPLGFNLGLETGFVLKRDILSLGDQRAVAPNITPVPRFWLGAEFPHHIKLSASLGLGGVFDAIQTYGFGTQWAFYNDEEKGVAFSVDFRFTHVNVFGDLSSNVMGFAAQATKDLILWQPYFGAGFLVGNSTANSEVIASGISVGPHTTATYHIFVGARIDLIAKLSIQLDVMAANPSLGVLLEKSF